MSHKPLLKHLRKQLLEEIDQALRQARTSPIADENVHAARKAMKKARAALRLMRHGLGKTAYQTENAALRDAGRSLAPVRDAASLLAALESLHSRYPKKFAGIELASLQAHLCSKREAAQQHLQSSPTGIEHCIALLVGSRARLALVDILGMDPDTVHTGLRRIYRQGRRTMDATRTAGTPAALHEWRKQVKYLRNALDACGKSDKAAMAQSTDKLAALLGEDHDLAGLAGEIVANPGRTVHKLIASRRAKLQKRAFALGEKLYHEQSPQAARRSHRDAAHAGLA